jgi:hypothetical protein
VSLRDGELSREPVFFLSYAHPNRMSRDEISFFEILTSHVNELTGAPPGAVVGFMDHSTMRGGERWTQELLDALRTCRVFVPLLSTRFVKSSWCAFEWEIFARRPVRRLHDDASGNGTAILPVFWSPIPDEALIPDDVKAVQRFAPRYLDDRVVEAYHRNGIYGLRRTDSAAYEAVAWELAMRIAEVHAAYAVEPGVPDLRDLRDPLWGEAG